MTFPASHIAFESPNDRPMVARCIAAPPPVPEVANTMFPIPNSLKKNDWIIETFWIEVRGASKTFIPISPLFWRTRLSVTA